MENTAMLMFHSFDGGGPEFSVVIADESLISYSIRRRYSNADHGKLCGAGYSVEITFTALRTGVTEITIEERSPIADNLDHVYRAAVGSELDITLEKQGTFMPGTHQDSI